MQEAQWIEWTRTRLHAQERHAVLAGLTSEQEAHLLDHDYVWVKGVGVLWNAADGVLRRGRFTHGTYFQTRRGEFYIDSAGSAHLLAGLRVVHPPFAKRSLRRPVSGEGSPLSLVPVPVASRGVADGTESTKSP